MTYYKRQIDKELQVWALSDDRKPLLLRGARQVGKSSAVRELGKSFKYFADVNLEKNPSLKQFFTEDIDVKTTCERLSAILQIPIIPGKTLLFIDEIQYSQSAIMSLRYFREDYPELHVIAAGSLLEFALEDLPSFAVGRIRSMYVYPFSFDEFLLAQGLDLLVDYRNKADSANPLPSPMHQKLIEQLKTFYLVGGLPAAVSKWISKRSYIECAHIHSDIIETYEDDFTKYKKRIDSSVLRSVLKSVALQAGSKFVFSNVSETLKIGPVKEALSLLTLSGLIIPVIHSNANGIPLGAEANNSYIKYLFIDLGVMQTLLGTSADEILLASDIDFVNKGAASETFAGLEIIKNGDCFRRAEMFYWQNDTRSGNAEVDYLIAEKGVVTPIEVKASTQGSMQSLWLFMNKKHLAHAYRTSLENFGQIRHNDPNNPDVIHTVDIVPLYALNRLINTLKL